MSDFFQVTISGLLLGGLYGLVSVGLTLIFGVMKMVNFAHGDFMMIGMYITYYFFSSYGLDPYLSILVGAPIMFILGLLIYQFVMKKVINASHSTQIFATMGLSLVLQNGALMLWGADFRNVNTGYSHDAVKISTLTISTPLLVAFIIATCVSAIFYWILKSTKVGKAIRATSQSAFAAQIMGINVSRIYMITFSCGIALVGVASAILSPMYPTYPTVGLQFVNQAFVCVVLGGLGSVPGAIIGGLIIGLTESLTGFYVGSEAQQAAYFLIFILILILKPTGIFNSQTRRLV